MLAKAWARAGETGTAATVGRAGDGLGCVGGNGCGCGVLELELVRSDHAELRWTAGGVPFAASTGTGTGGAAVRPGGVTFDHTEARAVGAWPPNGGGGGGGPVATARAAGSAEVGVAGNAGAWKPRCCRTGVMDAATADCAVRVATAALAVRGRWGGATPGRLPAATSAAKESGAARTVLGAEDVPSVPASAGGACLGGANEPTGLAGAVGWAAAGTAGWTAAGSAGRGADSGLAEATVAPHAPCLTGC